MSSTPPPAGSTGTTTAGSTDQSGWSHPPNTSKPATLRSYPRCSPYESGTKPGALQTAHKHSNNAEDDPDHQQARTRPNKACKPAYTNPKPQLQGLCAPGSLQNRERERENRDIGQSPESATEKSGPRINGCD